MGRITVQLLIVAIAPSIVLFMMVCTMMYAQRLSEVTGDLANQGNLLASSVAGSSEFAVVSGNIDSLYPTISTLVNEDHSVVAIAILSAERITLLETTKALKDTDGVAFERPIHTHTVQLDSFEDPKRNSTLQNSQIIGYVQVRMSPAAILSAKRSSLLLTGALVSLGAAISGFLGVRLTRRLRRQLLGITLALGSIKSSNYKVDPAKDANGELGQLHETIREMADNLHHSTHGLENTVAQRTLELNEALAALRKADQERRQLIHQVHASIEDERRIIAREIHDELNATVVSARLEAQRILTVAGRLEANSDVRIISACAVAITKLTMDLYDRGRSIVKRLRPEVLDTMGLLGAVEEMVSHYEELHPVNRFIFGHSGDLASIDPDRTIAIYRIIQEALSNVVKHSNATKTVVNVDVVSDPDEVLITVEDNGEGFDASCAAPGIGLIGIKERVFAYKGKVELITSLKKGVSLKVILPLDTSRFDIL